MRSEASPPRAGRDVRTFATGGPASELQLVALGGHHEGRVIPMRNGTVLGRSLDIGGSIDEEDVSRNHARLVRDETSGAWEIEDLHSLNGTWVNGARVLHRGALRAGDVVRLGAHVTFKVTSHDPVESELRERQRLELVGRISAGFIHDFNNMIGAGIANVDYVRSVPASERGEPHVDEALEDTYLALQRAAELASRLLQAARPDQGEGQSIDVSKLCAEVASMLRRVIPLTIQIEVRVAPRLQVVGSASSLQQVLVNLCLNARDAMQGGGTLRIEAASAEGGDRVVLRVGDTGTGMDAETLARIFEPFFTTKRGGRGFGLGLAMSADIVSQHGGRIEVDSAPGRGTTFSVVLPAARRTSATTGTTSPRLGAVVDGTGICVLVVDDQQAVRRGLRRVLSRVKFDVLEAASGVAALGVVASCPTKPHVALVDFDMPGMNGIETCKALRSILPGLRMILMSGGAVDCDDVGGASSPIGAQLQKPIESAALLETITKGLRERADLPSSPEDSGSEPPSGSRPRGSR